jgi:phosphohistidine phosphatase
MRLLFVRHAIAMDREEYARLSADDSRRPLTEEGARKMREGAGGLAAVADEPSAVFSSPYARAHATTEILLERAWAGLDVELRDELRPDRHPAELLAFLKARNSRRREARGCVALVGHEPHLSIAASWLVTGDQRPVFALKKGGACLIDFPKRLEPGSGQLCWLLQPRQLRALR